MTEKKLYLSFIPYIYVKRKKCSRPDPFYNKFWGLIQWVSLYQNNHKRAMVDGTSPILMKFGTSFNQNAHYFRLL